MGMAVGLSMDAIHPLSSKLLKKRPSMRHRNSKKVKKSFNKKAGNTPPPSSENAVQKFSDMVHDTDKKEGPINWWRLKVKMPNDSTMRLRDVQHLEKVDTPTTPEYIAK